jgi:hypothetical protein
MLFEFLDELFVFGGVLAADDGGENTQIGSECAARHQSDRQRG